MKAAMVQATKMAVFFSGVGSDCWLCIIQYGSVSARLASSTSFLKAVRISVMVWHLATEKMTDRFMQLSVRDRLNRA
ncbi:hypothetical protein [Nitrosomonas mobilis]|uniref:hypothetical protein n=1 Tax=Nitrosomonas mobilis TaxID=51642 RepID=UPI001C4098DA|nr:hypothetical protein [Nitrosomonas mobilis]